MRLADRASIDATLPALLPPQREDVFKAETRFAKPDGYGMLFTNGTGTGKTYTGLGIVKRYALQGKTDILIVAPSRKIIEDWVTTAERLGLTVTRLKNTRDAGRGIVITTYANMGDNDALASRQWQLVVADESHYFNRNEDGEETKPLAALRAITAHPRGYMDLAAMRHRELLNRASRLSDEAKLARTSDDQREWVRAEDLEKQAAAAFREYEAKRDAIKAEVMAAQGAARPRVVFLSATPFAYEKSVDYAEGYLFKYGDEQGGYIGAGYNSGNGRERFFMQHFGYRMRYNKLTEPEGNVDRGLMQRQFNAWLKAEGALSGRRLEVDADYDRRFILIDSMIGNRIDDALGWSWNKREEDRAAGEAGTALSNARSIISEMLRKQFDHIARRTILEAIKADAAVDIIERHLALGRKVVVFHDFKKGWTGLNPFNLESQAFEKKGAEEDAAMEQALAEYRREFADLIRFDFSKMVGPISTLGRAFAGRIDVVNGDMPDQHNLDAINRFNSDSTGPRVVLVQADKAEGWSGHDTTGKHQRILLNLGLPTKPATSMQQEGRIYRTGQVSDAIQRYMNTGTSWERTAFAERIAERASAVENLALGEEARALKEAFINAFEEADEYAPGHEGEGKGGKALDRQAAAVVTEWDAAKSFYWAQQKKTSKNKAKEGVDYFATPEPVGLKLVNWLGLREGETGMEPSAGHGAIARWFPDHIKTVAVEPSPELRGRLALVFNGDHATVRASTFEDLDVGANKADGIAMNPPFGIGGKTAAEHLAKAVRHLRDGGRVAAIFPRGSLADRRLDELRASEEWANVFPVADITLPSVTFNRAGTGVATRIVVFDKGVEPKSPQKNMDLSGIEDIRELFDRLENIELPARGKPEPTEAERLEALNEQANQAANAGRWGEVRAARAQEKAVKAAEKAQREQAGASLADQLGLKVIEHITGKGKTLRGVIRKDLTRDQVEQFDAYPFKKDGGWFIRERDLARAHELFPFKKGDDGTRFSQASRVPPEKQLPREQLEALAARIAARFPGAPRVEVARNAVEAGIDDRLPPGVHPSGAVSKGKIFLFLDGIAGIDEAERTIFHELFHAGLRKTLGVSEYHSAMRRLADKSQKVRDYAVRWIRSAEGQLRKGELNQQDWESLAVEEALADIAEEVGTSRLRAAANRPVIRAVVEWLAELAQLFRLGSWADKLRALPYSEAERFALDMVQTLASSPKVDTPEQGTRFRSDRAEAAPPPPPPAREAFEAFMRAAGQRSSNRFNVLHKTLATQLHKAMVDKDYARVFGHAQDYERDIARAASRPAELAPDLLPTFDNVRSAWHRLIYGNRDQGRVNQVGQALWAGTLDNGPEPHNGTVWTDQQLRQRFGLDDEQVRMYRQARAAIDASLDETAGALAYEMLKAYAPGIRDAIRENPADARRVIQSAAQAIQAAGGKGALTAAIGVLDRADELKAGGYAPLMRFGRYAVSVTDPKTGDLLHFEKFDGELQAKVAASKLAKQYPDADIQRTTMSEQDYKLFAGVDPESVALFAKQLDGHIQDEALQAWYRNAVSERSALKRMIGPRKGMAGYSTDVRRVLASFLTSNARLAARQLNMGDMAAAIEDMRQRRVAGDVLDEAIKLKEYLDNPQEPFAGLKALMFTWYLGGSVASAAVNATQPLMMTLPYLSQFGNASRALLGAVREAMTGRVADPDLAAALKRASDDGKVDPQEVHHLYHEGMQGIIDRLPGGDALRARSQGFMTLWGWMFGAVENFNRRLTFIAAYRMAEQNGQLGDPYRFAVRAIDETQGIYGKSNRPNWARGTGAFGAVGAAAFTFKQYSIGYVELLVRLAKSGPKGKAAALSMLGMMLFAAGLQGLPGAEDLEDLVDTVMQRLGYRGNSRAAIRETLHSALGSGLGDLVMSGVSAALPLDVQGRLGLGNLLPASGILMPSNQGNRAQQLAELVGPVGGLSSQVGDLLAGEGNKSALSAFAPLAVKNLLIGWEMAATGEYRDSRGRKVIDADLTDAAVKAVGFQPQAVAERRRPESMIRQDIARVRQVEAYIADLRAQAIIEGDPSLRAEADQALADWNAKNPELRINVTASQVQRRVQEQRRTSGDRLLKTAPKETRQAMAEALEL